MLCIFEMFLSLRNVLLFRLEAYVDERYKDSLKHQGKAEQVGASVIYLSLG